MHVWMDGWDWVWMSFMMVVWMVLGAAIYFVVRLAQRLPSDHKPSPPG